MAQRLRDIPLLPFTMIGDCIGFMLKYAGKKFGEGLVKELEPVLSSTVDTSVSRAKQAVKEQLNEYGMNMETNGGFIGKKLGVLLRRPS